MLSLAPVIYSYERNRRALDCKPSSLLAWDVHDEQLEKPGRHHAVQILLPGSDIVGPAPASFHNRLRELIARRPWQRKHQSAYSESVVRLVARQVCETGVPNQSIRLKRQSVRETSHPSLAKLHQATRTRSIPLLRLSPYVRARCADGLVATNPGSSSLRPRCKRALRNDLANRA